jgi:hypothetical protein
LFSSVWAARKIYCLHLLLSLSSLPSSSAIARFFRPPKLPPSFSLDISWLCLSPLALGSQEQIFWPLSHPWGLQISNHGLPPVQLAERPCLLSVFSPAAPLIELQLLRALLLFSRPPVLSFLSPSALHGAPALCSVFLCSSIFPVPTMALGAQVPSRAVLSGALRARHGASLPCRAPTPASRALHCPAPSHGALSARFLLRRAPCFSVPCVQLAELALTTPMALDRPPAARPWPSAPPPAPSLSPPSLLFARRPRVPAHGSPRCSSLPWSVECSAAPCRPCSPHFPWASARLAVALAVALRCS